MRTALLASLLLASTSLAANAVEIAVTYAEDSLTISGSIERGDEGKLAQVLDSRNSRGVPTNFIFLNSPGGAVNAAHDMAEIIRTRGIPVGVLTDDQCNSSCFMLFAAAPDRHFSDGVAIGLHSALTRNEDGTTEEGQRAQATTLRIARYLKEVGTPDDLVTAMLVTPADSITWATTEQLARGGWATYHPAEVAENDPKPEPAIPNYEYKAPMVRPSQPAKPDPLSISTTMYCQPSTSGRTPYWVQFWQADDGAKFLKVRETTYKVADLHLSKSGNAWVVGGKTKYGTYGGVFGGDRPRMRYSNGKELVVDDCQMATS